MRTMAISECTSVRQYVSTSVADTRIPGSTDAPTHRRTDAPAHRRTGALLALALLLALASAARATGPDLTVGTNRYTIDNHSYNLGPTGMRGWLSTRYGGSSDGNGLETADDPWQICVTTVGTGTPAYGVIQTSDVILGAQAGGGTVTNFGFDARKSLGWAIGAAEATNGVLRLLINRYGVGSNQTYSLQLKLTNLAYSATAPYNCPKSARILADAVKVISNMAFTAGTPGAPVLGLAKMAVGITNAALKAYANSIAPATGSLNPYNAGSWDWGYNNLFLCEYFLFTGDTSVTNGIREYAINSARIQDPWGQVGHGGCVDYGDGTYNHPITWYGPMNQASMPLAMGIVMAKKCGIAAPEIDPAIARENNWLNYYVDKGGIPYGEHESWPGGHDSNGKDNLAAMYFVLQGNQPTQTAFYTRMSVSCYNGRETGHTGCGFSYLWSGLAANIGGTNALASHLAQVLWNLDLSRRYDGSFTFDGSEAWVSSSGINDYWQPNSYYGMDQAAIYVLTFATPSRRLYVTGRNPNPTNTLSAAVVSNAIWAGQYNQICQGYTTNQLLAHFSEYDPSVRMWAANTLATTPGSNNLVNLLIGMTTSNDPHVRASACRTLGVIKNAAALPTLAALMYDTDVWVRTVANAAMRDWGGAASANPYLTNMMTAFITYGSTNQMVFFHGSTNQYAIDWSDPVRIANGYLANALFSQYGSSTINQPTNLLYQAVTVGLAQPDGMALGYLGDFIENQLTWTHVQMVAPSIVNAVMYEGAADRMFTESIRNAGVLTLAKYKVEEGIPLATLFGPSTFWEPNTTSIDALRSYGGAAKNVIPTMYQWLAWLPSSGIAAANQDIDTNAIWLAIAAISNDIPRTLTNTFKNITVASATPSPLTITTTSNAVLTCTVNDKDKGTPFFVWSKTQGVGNVTFSLNSSTAASNSTATFSAPGTYVLQATVVDRTILNSNVWGSAYMPFQYTACTNLYGAVYTNITIKVYNQPFVDITNADFSVGMNVAAAKIGGTNNAAVAGGMQVMSVANGATNYTASIPATTPWTIMVSNLMANATNFVTMAVTNGMGVATNDTVRIYRPAFAFLQVTNIPGNYIVLPSSSNTWLIAGTNNPLVVGGMVWTNAAIGGGKGTLSPGPGNWSFNVGLVLGFNVVTVQGTNSIGNIVTDIVTIVKGIPPMIRITNLTTASTLLVPSTAANQYIAGTNSASLAGATDGFRWTNALGGATGTLTRPTPIHGMAPRH